LETNCPHGRCISLCQSRVFLGFLSLRFGIGDEGVELGRLLLKFELEIAKNLGRAANVIARCLDTLLDRSLILRLGKPVRNILPTRVVLMRRIWASLSSRPVAIWERLLNRSM
jgi:hypothetical protein